jgi:hypothetical protein
MTTKVLWSGEAVVLALFALSLFLPAFRFEKHAPVMGRELLLWGWWGLLMYNVGWLANLLFGYTVVLMWLGRFSTARIVSAIALVCASHSFAVQGYCFDESAVTPIKSFGPAFYVWLSSIALQCVLAFTAAGWSR